MPRHRPLKTIGALVCILFVTNAHAVPLITDWGYALSSISARLAEHALPAPPRAKARIEQTFSQTLSDATVNTMQPTPAGNSLGSIAIRLVKTAVQQASAPATDDVASLSDTGLVLAPQTTLIPDAPPLRFSSQLSLWVADSKGADARRPHFVGSQDFETRLPVTRAPIQDGFPLNASALNGLPALARSNGLDGLSPPIIRSLPEPAPLALFGVGLLGVALMRRSPR